MDDTNDQLELGDTELGTITAAILRIGDTTTQGAITITQAISPNNAPVLTLLSSGTVTDGGAGIITTTGLQVSSAGATLDAANNVTNLAAVMSGDGTDFIFTGETDGFTVTTVDTVVGITTANAASDSGDITMSSAGPIVIFTGETDGFTVTTVDTVVGITTANAASDSGDITMSSAGPIVINQAMTTGNDTPPANGAADDIAVTGFISVTSTGSTINGDANGILTTGVATVDATGGDAGGGDTATSGSITLSASGAIQLAAANALTIGNAVVVANTGNDNATTGNIIVTTAAKISSNGANAEVDVSFGTATGGQVNTAGVLRATTTGAGGDAGGIFFTSGEALSLGALDTADGTSQNIDIEVTGGATLTVAEASTLDTDSLGLFADVMAINAALSAGSVDIADSTGGIAIDLGTEAGGLSLPTPRSTRSRRRTFVSARPHPARSASRQRLRRRTTPFCRCSRTKGCSTTAAPDRS